MKCKTKIDKAWSVKHEGKFNPDNIIFTSNKYKELVEKLKKVDNNLGKRARNETK